MKKFIKNIEGLITETELKKAGMTRRDSNKKKNMVDQAFAEMDLDNDGYINEDEFVKAVLGHGKVSKILATKIIDVLLPSTN